MQIEHSEVCEVEVDLEPKLLRMTFVLLFDEIITS